MATIFTLHVGFADANGNDRHAAHNRGFLFDALNHLDFSGYTVLDGIGWYQGKREPGASVVFIAQTPREAVELEHQVRKAGELYKKLAEQEEVWLTIRHEELEVI